MRALLMTAAGICLLSAGAVAQTSTPTPPSLQQPSAADPSPTAPGAASTSGSTSAMTPSSPGMATTEGRQASDPNDKQAQSQNWNDRNGNDEDENDSDNDRGNWRGRGDHDWYMGRHMGWGMRGYGPHGRWGMMGGRGGRFQGGHGRWMMGQGAGGGGAFFAFRSPRGGFMVRCERGEQMKDCVDAIMPLIDKMESMRESGSNTGTSSGSGSPSSGSNTNR